MSIKDKYKEFLEVVFETVHEECKNLPLSQMISRIDAVNQKVDDVDRWAKKYGDGVYKIVLDFYKDNPDNPVTALFNASEYLPEAFGELPS